MDQSDEAVGTGKDQKGKRKAPVEEVEAEPASDDSPKRVQPKRSRVEVSLPPARRPPPKTPALVPDHYLEEEGHSPTTANLPSSSRSKGKKSDESKQRSVVPTGEQFYDPPCAQCVKDKCPCAKPDNGQGACERCKVVRGGCRYSRPKASGGTGTSSTSNAATGEQTRVTRKARRAKSTIVSVAKPGEVHGKSDIISKNPLNTYVSVQ